MNSLDLKTMINDKFNNLNKRLDCLYSKNKNAVSLLLVVNSPDGKMIGLEWYDFEEMNEAIKKIIKIISCETYDNEKAKKIVLNVGLENEFNKIVELNI